MAGAHHLCLSFCAMGGLAFYLASTVPRNSAPWAPGDLFHHVTHPHREWNRNCFKIAPSQALSVGSSKNHPFICSGPDSLFDKCSHKWIRHCKVSPAALWDHPPSSPHGERERVPNKQGWVTPLSTCGPGVGREKKAKESTSPYHRPGSGVCSPDTRGGCAAVVVEGLPTFFIHLMAISSLSLKTFAALPYGTTWHCCLQLFHSSLLVLLSSLTLNFLKS